MNKQEHVWKGKEGGMYCVWRTKSLLQRSQTVYKIEKLVKKKFNYSCNTRIITSESSNYNFRNV